MGTREAPGPDPVRGIRTRRLPWLPAWPEATSGLPMMEVVRSPPCYLRAFSASVVSSQ